MDEQLENTIERGGDHAAIHEKTDVPPADREINEKADKETRIESLQQVNIESPTEEAVNAPDAGLSSTEVGEIPSPQVATAKGLVSGGEEEGPPSTEVDDERPQAPCKRATEQSEALGESQVFPPADENVVQGRDYYAEWQELAEAHPEVVGKELPEDIYQACMQSELPPLRVYESMMLQKQNEQIVALQQEIATLRQNAENTARAPVVAAAEGPTNEPESLFMKGFYSY